MVEVHKKYLKFLYVAPNQKFEGYGTHVEIKFLLFMLHIIVVVLAVHIFKEVLLITVACIKDLRMHRAAAYEFYFCAGRKRSSCAIHDKHSRDKEEQEDETKCVRKIQNR